MSDRIRHFRKFVKLLMMWLRCVNILWTWIWITHRSHWIVVDPSICFSWIESNWEESDIREAKKVIIKLVSLIYYDIIYCLSFHFQLQMTEHRRLARPQSGSPELNQPQQPPNTRPTNCRAVTSTKLTAQYRLPTMHTQQPVNNEQTVEQKLASYTTASCSPEGTDPLSFWAVSQIRLLFLVHDPTSSLVGFSGV